MEHSALAGDPRLRVVAANPSASIVGRLHPSKPRLLAKEMPFSETRRALRIRSYAALLVSDLACLLCAFALGAAARFSDLHNLEWLRVSLAVIPLYIGIAVHSGAYNVEALKSSWVGIGRAVAALASAFAVLLVVAYFLKAAQDVSRLSTGLGLVSSFTAIALGRWLVGRWITMRSRGELTSTLVITDETYVQKAPNAVIVDAAHCDLKPEPRNLVMVQRLAELVQNADRVIVACPRESSGGWASLLKSVNVRGEIVADEVQSVGALAVGDFGERTTLVVASGPLTIQQQIIKRAFDLLMAVPILILVAPVMIGVAIAIKLSSPGPILFRQKRVGFGNRFFEIYKFRSMRSGSTDQLGTNSTLRGDPRITKVGHFIRRTSLDELPQLLNVIGGSMSLVGPRPHAVGSFAGPLAFWDVDDRYGHRHLLKPGITGLAQIRGLRGTAHQVDDLSRRLQSDLEYVNGWSVWRDAMIVVKTCGVLVHPNAY